MKPRLLLVDERAARRLSAVAALSARFEVVPVGDGEDPLRAARSHRPDLAIVVVARRKPEMSLRLCRMLRTDLRPVPCVGLVDPGPTPRPAAEVQLHWLADGYLAMACSPEELLAFGDALWRGERPCVEAPPAGRVRRMLSRLRDARRGAR